MSFIVGEINGKIASLSLNNEKKLNALSSEVVNDAVAFIKECKEKKVLVLLLKAQANKHNVWSAGHDVSELPIGRRDPLGYDDSLEVLLRSVKEFPGPVIGVVRGSVWGAACDLIMTCDLVYADKTSTFAITPAKLGVPYNPSGIQHFVNRIGLNMAKEMFFTAQPVDCAIAEKWGIVNRIFEVEELDAKVMEVAQKICANAPLAVQVSKQQINMLSDSMSAMNPVTFELLQGLRRKVYDSHDYAEGIASFKEKRKPVYTGE
ncbi:MAG: methylmalonyl-CoA decarboxylase [Lentisphaerota bacterium]